MSIKKIISLTTLLFAFSISLTWAQSDEPLTPEEYQAVFESEMTPPRNLQPQAATPCIAGFAGSYPCNQIDLMAFMPLATIGGGNGNDSWGWTDPLTGKEYALMGRTSGASFVDISDPANPIYLGNLPTATINSTWRDIKVYANYAFVVSEAGGHGMQIFDLTRLRSVAAPPEIFTSDALYNGFGRAHNVVINEDTGFAYGVGTDSCGGGLHAVDISNPLAPIFAGCFGSDGYTHDAQCVLYNGPDLAHIGKEICFAYNADTVTIVDMNDKSAPVQLSRTTYSGRGYTHQGWLTEDQQYILFNDETDETSFGHNTRTRIFDAADLDNPVLLGFVDGRTTAIDHNIYTWGRYIFESNYRAGVQILDGSNVAAVSLPEVAYFDTYPANDNASYASAWNAFPYFPSGNLIVSTLGEGLFILDPALAPDFRLDSDKVALEVCGTQDQLEILVEPLYGYAANVNLTLSGVPGGETAVLSPSSGIPPFTSTLTISKTGAANGDFLLTLNGTDGLLSYDEYLKLTLGELLGTAAPTTPANGSISQPVTSPLSWNAALNATSYQVELAADPDFAVILDSAIVTGTTWMPAPLTAETVYFWRVTAINNCGTTVSAVYSFQTKDVPSSYSFCSSPNLLINNAAPTVVDTMVITASGQVGDLNLYLYTPHNYVGDLTFTLEHLSSGISAAVIDRPGVPASTYGCSGRDIDVDLDDEAALPVEDVCGPTPPTITDFYQPNEPLSLFDGELISGTWQLTVSDFYPATDDGTLAQWCLFPTTQISAPTPADYSDLPSSFAIAWHTVNSSTIQLGPTNDADTNFLAGADDSSDDGITLSGDFAPGKQLTLTADIQLADGYLACWFDWDRDGRFSAIEKSVAQAVTTGNLIQPLTVPAGYDPANDSSGLESRCRTYPTEPLLMGLESPEGKINGGEVEDYSFPPLCWSPPIVTATISAANPDAQLNWSLVAADLYEIWWSDTPYQMPGPDCGAAANCVTTISNSYLDNGILDNPSLNRYYYIKASNSCGLRADNSNYIGSFEYPILPGS